jgi:hypothetical protein
MLIKGIVFFLTISSTLIFFLESFASCKNAALIIPNASHITIGATLDNYDIQVACNIVNGTECINPEGNKIFKVLCINGTWNKKTLHSCNIPPAKPIYGGRKNFNCSTDYLNIANATLKFNNITITNPLTVTNGSQIAVTCNAGYFASMLANNPDNEEGADPKTVIPIGSYSVTCDNGVFTNVKNCTPICSVDNLKLFMNILGENITVLNENVVTLTGGSKVATVDSSIKVKCNQGGIKEIGSDTYNLKCVYSKVCYDDSKTTCELLSYFKINDPNLPESNIINADINAAESEVYFKSFPRCSAEYKFCKKSDIDSAITTGLLDSYNTTDKYIKTGVTIRLTCADSVLRSQASSTASVNGQNVGLYSDSKSVTSNANPTRIVSDTTSVDTNQYNVFNASEPKLVTAIKLDSNGRQYSDITCRDGSWEPSVAVLQCPGETKSPAV